MVAGGVGAMIRWNVETGEEELRYYDNYDTNSPSGTVTLVISPDGKYLLRGGCESLSWETYECNDGQFGWTLYDYESGEQLHQLLGKQYLGIFGQTFTADSKSFFVEEIPNRESWDEGSTYKQFDVVTGEVINVLYDLGGVQIKASDLSEDGKTVLLGDANGEVTIYDLQTGEPVQSFVDSASVYNNQRVQDVDFGPRDKTVMAAFRSGLIILWDVASGEELYRFQAHDNGIESAELSPYGDKLITSTQELELHLFDMKQGNQLAESYPANGKSLSNIDRSPDGELLAIGSGNPLDPYPFGDASVLILNAETLEVVQQLDGYQWAIHGLDFSPDGTSIAIADGVTPTNIRDIQSGDILQEFALDYNFDSLSFSPDGRTLLTTGHGNTTRLWDVASGVEIHRMVYPDNHASVARISPDGQYGIGGSDLGEGLLMDLRTGEVIQRYDIGSNRPADIQFIADGQMFVVAGTDGVLRVLNTESGETISEISGLEIGFLYPMALTSDEKRVVVPTADNNLALYDLATGEQLAQFIGNEQHFVRATFGHDDNTLYSVSTDGSLRTWTLPPESKEEVLSWANRNRFVAKLTESERVEYGLSQGEASITDTRFESILTTDVVTDFLNPTPTEVIVPTTVPAMRLAIVGEQRGDVPVGGKELWSFEAQTGDMITINVQADNPMLTTDNGTNSFHLEEEQFDSYVTVRDPNGQIIIQNLENGGFERFDTADSGIGGNTTLEAVVLSTTGIYEIEVRGFNYISGGAYTLTIQDVK